MAVVFKNNAKTTLASGINSSVTSITVTNGALLPSLTGSDFFFATIDDGTNNEIVKVTARSSNTLTVVRAQDNTTAQSFSTGAVIELRLTAAILELFSQTGVAITDEIEAYLDANGLTFPDNVKAQFGANNDLQIFHNGTVSNIKDAGTGILQLTTNGDAVQIYDTANFTTMARFNTGGAVTLNHASTQRFQTTATGINVDGTIVSDAETAFSTTANTPNASLIVGNAASTVANGNYKGAVGFARGSNTTQVRSAIVGKQTHNSANRQGLAFLVHPDTVAGTLNEALLINHDSTASFSGALQINGTTVIDSSRNLTNIGTITSSGNATFNGSVNKFTGDVEIEHNPLILDTNPSNSYGVTEALRIDDSGGTNDRALQIFELLHSGARSHRLTFNTNITTDGSAYTYTQGNYGGSSQIEFGNSGPIVFYTNAQNTGGSTTAITPIERFRIKETGEVQVQGELETGGLLKLDYTNPTLTLRPDNSAHFNIKANESPVRLELGHSINKNLYLSNTGGATFNYDLNVVSNFKINGTTVIDSSRNLTNIGTISSGAITSSGNISTGSSSTLTAHTINFTGELNFTNNGNKIIDVFTKANGNNLKIRHHDPSDNSFETAAQFTAGGGAVFLHAGNTKLQTTSTGIDVTGSLTASGNIDVNSDSGQLQFGADNDMQIFHNGANGEINNATGNFIIDSAGDITLDADGQDILFKDGGTQFGSIRKNGNNLQLMASIQDGDITFHGDDGGSAITALALDMSAGGNATFAGTIDASGQISQTVAGSNYFRSIASSTGNAGLFMRNTVRDWFVLNNSAGTLELYDGTANAVRMSINTSGNTTFAGTISGTLASSVTATTQSAGDNSTKVATTAYTDTAIANLADSAPSTLNTLNELAAALGDDANFSTTVTNSIATKLPLAGGTMTGNLTLNGADIVKSGSADLTVDVGGRINLSADDNGEIRLYDGSSLYGQFKDDDDRLSIQGLIQDKDMLFVVNDGGSMTTALKLDAADGGDATFYGTISSGAITSTGQVKAQSLFIDSGGYTPQDAEGQEFKYYLVSQGTDQNFKKVADVTISTGSYKALALRVVLESQAGNFGNTIAVDKTEYVCNFYRSAASQDDQDTAQISGQDPTHHNLRIVKTATGVYELQVRQNANYRDAILKLEVLSTNGGTFTVTDGNVNGSTSGTITTPISNESASTYSFNKVDTPFLNIQNTIKVNSTQILDASRNLTNIGTISSGGITSTGNLSLTTTGSEIMLDAYNTSQEGGGIFFREGFQSSNKYNLSIIARSRSNDGSADGLSINGYEGVFFSTGSNSYQERFGIDVSGNIAVGGTTILDQSRNLSNIASLNIDGDIFGTGNFDIRSTGNIFNTFGNSSKTFFRTQNGTVRFVIDSAGKIGAGGNIDESPDANLHIRTSDLGGTSGDQQEIARFSTNVSNGSSLRVYTERHSTGTDWQTAQTKIQQRIDVTDQGYILFNGSGNTYGIELGTHATAGQINLRHKGTVKLNTVNAGVNVTGDLQVGTTTVIDSSRNLTNIGTVSCGAITSSGNMLVTANSSSNHSLEVKRASDGSQALRINATGEVVVSNNYLYASNSGTSFYSEGDAVFRATIRNDQSGMPVKVSDDFNVTGAYQSNGTTIIDSSRNLTNIGTVSCGAITTSGNFNQTAGTFLTHGDEVTSLTTAWQAAGTSKNRGLYPFRYQNGATGQPESGNNANWGLNIYAHAGSGGNYPHGTQFAMGSSQNLYFRWFSNGSAQDWKEVVTANTSGNVVLDGEITSSATIQSNNGSIVSNSTGEAQVKLISTAGVDNTSYVFNSDTGFGTYNQTDANFYWFYDRSASNFNVYAGSSLITRANSSGLQVHTGGYYIAGTEVITSSRNLTNIGTISSGAITSSGIIEAAGALRVTETGSLQSILIGNQDSAGVNKPAMIQGVNGYLRFGHGNSWSGEGGTFTEVFTTSGNNVTIANNLTVNGNVNLGNATSDTVTVAGTISSGAITSSGLIRSNDSNYYGKVDAAVNYRGFGDVPIMTGVSGATYLYAGGSTSVCLTLQSSRTIAPQLAIGQVNNFTTVIDSSRNLTNIGTISSGSITTSGSIITGDDIVLPNNKDVIFKNASGSDDGTKITRASGNALRVKYTGNSLIFDALNDNQVSFRNSDDEEYIRFIPHNNPASSALDFLGSLRHGTTTIINSSRNLLNIGTISSGAITSSGDITAFSDERLKDNIQTLDGKKALQMRGVSFIRDGKEGSGVIAQEIEKIAPELVATADDEQGTKSVAYGNLVGYLIEAIKEQQDQIEYMKSEIKTLKEANNGNK